MPTNYPGSLDALTNPTAANTLAEVPHDEQHADANDAIEAIEAKLGTGASTPTTAGHFLKVTGAGATGYSAHGLTAADVGADASGTAASEVATHAADTTGVHGIADTSALATSSDVTTAVSTHEAAADPHTGYQKESEKGAASGYASLDASTKVPIAQVPTGTSSSTVSLGNHAHSFSGAKVYHSTTENHTASGSYVAVSFDTEEYDTDAYHSTASNTSRLTAPATDYYRLTAKIQFAANATGIRGVYFRLNGTTMMRFGHTQNNNGASTGTSVITTTDVSLAAGDYVEVMAYQNTGGTLALGHASDDASRNTFIMARLG